MTDAHCHVTHGESRHILCSPLGTADVGGTDAVFRGVHPWDAAAVTEIPMPSPDVDGVGEIGLDRLKVRDIPPAMREAFARQLAWAAEHAKPVVLHGAKCWGEVAKACRPYAGRIPAFLFHGFSRSDGLLPDIAALNGFVSVGPAVLNDHAVNYRALVKRIPLERLLVESDRTPANADAVPSVAVIAAKVAELRGVTLETLEPVLEANADRFLGRTP